MSPEVSFENAPTIEHDEQAVSAFSSSITRILTELALQQEKDVYIDPKYSRELICSEEEVEAFARHVYYGRGLNNILNIKDLEVGADTLNAGLKADRHSRAEAAGIQYSVDEGQYIGDTKQKAEFCLSEAIKQKHVDNIAYAEIEALYKIAMWKMTNEICSLSDKKEVTAEQFVDMIEESAISENLASETEIDKCAGERYQLQMHYASKTEREK